MPRAPDLTTVLRHGGARRAATAPLYEYAGVDDTGATQVAQASLYLQPAVGAGDATYEDTSPTGANTGAAAGGMGGAQGSLYYQPALSGSGDYAATTQQGNEELFEGFGI